MMSVKSKNIHVLPTDKPSKLAKSTKSGLNAAKKGEGLYKSGRFGITTFNIYITSDEEIKEVDWCFYVNSIYKVLKISSNNRPIIKMSDGTFEISYYRKIILTTDQDLIKDGVQAIDDEFLDWFVKNPSCECVEVKDLYEYPNIRHIGYKIIIPKEEHKQETLGYGLLQHIKMCLECNNESQAIRLLEKYGFEKQERMYSEEELLAFGKSCFYKGFEKSEKDDANCFTAFREEIGSLVKKFKNK